MKISIVRGALLNPFEIQNYLPLGEDFDIQIISSKYTTSDKIGLLLKKLWSPTDLPNFPYKYPILNFLFTDAHKLFGLEKIISGSDIVHTAETYTGFTHQVVMAKRRGLVGKIICTVTETIIPKNDSRKRKQYRQYAYENIDKFIVTTNKARGILLKEGVPDQKIELVSLGTDLQRFKPKTGANKSNNVRILFVGRLAQEKGVTDLIDAFVEILKKNNKVWLTFVGEGSLRHDLTGFKNITVKRVSHSRIHNEYQSSDIFCLPSRKTNTWEEQNGLSLIEAMASGLPVITSDTGVIPEICGTSALFFKPGNKIALRKNIEYLINNPDIRKSMGKASRARAAGEYDLCKTAKRIGEIYRQLALR